MFTTLFSLSLLVTLIHTVLAQSSFSIDTPTLSQCEPAQLTWTASNYPPYDLYVVSAEDMCGDALENLGNQTSTAMTWTANLAAGTQIVLYIEDSEGNAAWSGSITVGSSNDTSCLASSPSSATPSGTTLAVAPSGAAATPTTTPTSSAVSPAGAASNGEGPTSGALSTRPLNAVTLLSSAILAAVAFAL